jgi:hypothetical protein
MRNVEVEELSSSSIEADLARLEAGLRQLKIQYDMFFAGALPREPHELRSQFEQMIRRYSNAPIRKYAHRFHFNALVSRYTSMSEFWSKTIRTIEEGDRLAPAVIERHGARERTVTTCRVEDPSKEQESLRTLHECFLEARRKHGGENGGLTFDSFYQGVVKQANRIREKTGCAEVELRLVIEDRKVHLKAKPSNR